MMLLSLLVVAVVQLILTLLTMVMVAMVVVMKELLPYLLQEIHIQMVMDQVEHKQVVDHQLIMVLLLVIRVDHLVKVTQV